MILTAIVFLTSTLSARAASVAPVSPPDLTPYKDRVGRVVVAAKHPERVGWDFRRLAGQRCSVDYATEPGREGQPSLYVNGSLTKTYEFSDIGKSLRQGSTLTYSYLHQIPVREAWDNNTTYSCTDWQASHVELRDFTEALIMKPEAVEFRTTYSCARLLIGHKSVEESLSCEFSN